jgi:hypothetical protein
VKAPGGLTATTPTPTLWGVRSLAGTIAAIAAIAFVSSAAAAPGVTGVGVLNDIVRGNDSSVVARFNPQMRATLSTAGLKAGWAAYQLEFGGYVSHGPPEVVSLGANDVVRIPLRMARRQGEFRVTFEANGEIAGLYFLRTGVPV